MKIFPPPKEERAHISVSLQETRCVSAPLRVPLSSPPPALRAAHECRVREFHRPRHRAPWPPAPRRAGWGCHLPPARPQRVAAHRPVGPGRGRLHPAHGRVPPGCRGRAGVHRIRAHAALGGRRAGDLLGCSGPARAGQRAAVQAGGSRAAPGAERGGAAGVGGGLCPPSDRRGAAALHAGDPRRRRQQPALSSAYQRADQRRAGACARAVVPALQRRRPRAGRGAEEPGVAAQSLAAGRPRSLGGAGQPGARAGRAGRPDRPPQPGRPGHRAAAEPAPGADRGGHGSARDRDHARGGSPAAGAGERRAGAGHR